MVHVVMYAVVMVIISVIPAVWHRISILQTIINLARTPRVKQTMFDHRYCGLLHQTKMALVRLTSVTVPLIIASFIAIIGLWISFVQQFDIEQYQLAITTLLIAYTIAHCWTLPPITGSLLDWLTQLHIANYTAIMSDANEQLVQLGTEIAEIDKSNGDPAVRQQLVDKFTKAARLQLHAKQRLDLIKQKGA